MITGLPANSKTEARPQSALLCRIHEPARRLRRAEKQAANGATGTLVKDPKTGEYRLAKD